MGVTMIKNVCGGTAELMSGDVELTIAGDSIDFECNDECTVDDVSVNITSGAANDVYALRIKYPSSNQIATIAEFTLTAAPPFNFFLNNATTGVGKLWFRIPARGHLILEAITLGTGTGKANMVALVRGGA